MASLARVLPALLMVSACVPGPEAQTALQTTPAQAQMVPMTVPRGKAVVYFYRPENFSGSANVYQVAINGVPTADLRSGTRYAALTAPGVLRISAHSKLSLVNFGLAHAMMEKPTLSLTVRPGTVRYVKITPGFAGGPQLQAVGGEVARPALPKLRPAAVAEPEG